MTDCRHSARGFREDGRKPSGFFPALRSNTYAEFSVRCPVIRMISSKLYNFSAIRSAYLTIRHN